MNKNSKIMTINEKLFKLYSEKWDILRGKQNAVLTKMDLAIKPTSPLLINLKDEIKWEQSDIRLMFFGQETNGWGGNFNGDLEYVIDIYKDFFNSDYCWSYGGQFWNGISRFIVLLKEKYPSKSISIVWNNLVKIGISNDKGFPPDYIYEIERESFSVIQGEIDILHPNMILFLSGPNYDKVVRDNFGNLNYSIINGFSTRQLARLDLKNVENVFRTYHPNFLWRNNIDHYFESIIKDLKF